ncbi:MAG: hypothetical protein H6828_14955 [Planctomycetes bacterium]|nr:hypothetical protein [Planctomycetota bacterium]
MDAPPPSPPARRRRARRLLVVLAVLALTLATLGLWAPPLAERVAPWAAREFADVELELVVDELGWSGVAVRDLRARELGDAPVLARLRARRLAARLAWPALARGDLGGLESASADGLELELRLDRLEPAPAEPRATPFELPARLPRLALELARVDVVLPGDVHLEVTRGALAVDADQQVRLDGLAARGPDWTTRPLALRARRAGDALEQLALDVEGEALLADSRVDLARVGAGAVALDLRPTIGGEGARVTAELDGSGGTSSSSSPRSTSARPSPRAGRARPRPRGRARAQRAGRLAWDAPGTSERRGALRPDAARAARPTRRARARRGHARRRLVARPARRSSSRRRTRCASRTSRSRCSRRTARRGCARPAAPSRWTCATSPRSAARSRCPRGVTRRPSTASRSPPT